MSPPASSIRIGQRLRHERENRGWLQRDLAKALEISQQYVDLIERGQRPLTTSTAARLEKLWGLQLTLVVIDEPGGTGFTAALEAMRKHDNRRMLEVFERLTVNDKAQVLALARRLAAAPAPLTFWTRMFA